MSNRSHSKYKDSLSLIPCTIVPDSMFMYCFSLFNDEALKSFFFCKCAVRFSGPFLFLVLLNHLLDYVIHYESQNVSFAI